MSMEMGFLRKFLKHFGLKFMWIKMGFFEEIGEMVTSKFKKITTYNSIVKITIAYGVETWEFLKI